MPIVPYQDGGQVPLGAHLPSFYSPSSISSALLPTFPSAVVYPPHSPEGASAVAPDAPDEDLRPTIDIPTEHHLHDTPTGQAPSSTFVSAGGSSSDSEIQMKGRKPAIAAAGTFLSLFTLSQIYQNALFPKLTPISERAEEKTWVASSHSWLDRKVCNWFGFCGIAHLSKARWSSKPRIHSQQQKTVNGAGTEQGNDDFSAFWQSGTSDPRDWSEEEQDLRKIPDYVYEYAPYIHLFSGEKFWPGDIAEHLIHTTPHLNYTPLQAVSDHPNLTNLDKLNDWGRFVYLQSDDNVEDRPEWLGGESNIPGTPEDDGSDSDPNWEDLNDRPHGKLREDKDGEKESWFNSGIGDTKDKGGIRPPPGASTSPVPVPVDTPEGEELLAKEETRQPELLRRKTGSKVVGGRSDAPAVLVVVPKDDGVVDAFWFFFYSYNLGNTVFNVRFGNHVGDWEHTVVRFQHGKPKAVFFSEHSFGEAYSFGAVEKLGKRPVGYSATGTHAMYASPGVHPYILPGGILHDEADRGPLWDPTLNVYSYTYDYKNDTLRSSDKNPHAPTEWFYFMGHWGDKFYPLSDPRQYRFVGQYHYVNGPLGPRFKNLGRKEICQGNDECLLKSYTSARRAHRIKRFHGVGEGEEMNEEDVKRFVGPEDESF
ncbi:vacuolar sorting-associated protein-like protein [Amniculicola lignicola CBS 123094]|uniref:Vacuolar sorting-associated protein-like protein n=1 Tax=Amniculicola lignicola CBS 123094 TaxID=1392246 RepID=A0A6A5WK36_9PLEO|nr:vacuolar sorting-associated protein-like protein [Amniculicola lignicola CBS 123094]